MTNRSFSFNFNIIDHYLTTSNKTHSIGQFLSLTFLFRLCLQEVERCSIFVGLLGERYGWIPTMKYESFFFLFCSQVPDEVKLKYEWKNGSSVTAMEVMHALKKEKKCSFYIRSPNVTKNIPNPFASKFQEDKVDVKVR